MNGTMLLSSEYATGTKVKIILDQKIETKSDSKIIKYDELLSNKTILAVDDSESALKIIDKLLKDIDISIDTAMTSKECIEKVKVNKYDLILLDEQLSKLDGNQVFAKLKKIRNFNIPVVLLTKDEKLEYNDDPIKEGFAGCILKPLKKKDFINKINQFINKQ